MKKHNRWQLEKGGPEIYEQYIVPAFSGAWAEDMVNRAGLKHGERVLDLACGTGIVARKAHAATGSRVRLLGADANRIVLDKGRDLCAKTGIAVSFHQAVAGALPFGAGSVQVALCQQGLQYFPDRAAALSEIHRILAPGGRVVFSVWRPLEYSPFYLALHQALGRFVNPTAAGMLSAAYTLGKAEDVRRLFTSAGFREINIRLVIKQMQSPCIDDFLGAGLSASPFAADIAALPESRREQMFGVIREAMAEYMDDHGLAAPMGALVVTALTPG